MSPTATRKRKLRGLSTVEFLLISTLAGAVLLAGVGVGSQFYALSCAQSAAAQYVTDLAKNQEMADLLAAGTPEADAEIQNRVNTALLNNALMKSCIIPSGLVPTSSPIQGQYFALLKPGGSITFSDGYEMKNPTSTITLNTSVRFGFRFTNRHGRRYWWGDNRRFTAGMLYVHGRRCALS